MSSHMNPRPGTEEADFFDARLRFRAAHLGLTPLAMAYLEGREKEIAALTARVRALEQREEERRYTAMGDDL